MTLIFDPQKIQAKRNRAIQGKADFFLHTHAAKHIANRLNDIKRTFERPIILSMAEHPELGHKTTCPPPMETLDLKPSSHDLIINIMGLHSVNDLPGMMVQIKRALQPDGAFLFALPGAESLTDTKELMMRVENDAYNGASARFHPMIRLQQMAGLMQRAGFALPVVDSETIKISAPSLIRALSDIRYMGEGLGLHGYTPRPLNRHILNEVETQHKKDKLGRLEFNIEMIYGIGWAPHESQQKPKARGSATQSLTEIL